VRIRPDEDRPAFATPGLLREGPVAQALVQRVATVLRVGREEVIDAERVDNGP